MLLELRTNNKQRFIAGVDMNAVLGRSRGHPSIGNVTLGQTSDKGTIARGNLYATRLLAVNTFTFPGSPVPSATTFVGHHFQFNRQIDFLLADFRTFQRFRCWKTLEGIDCRTDHLAVLGELELAEPLQPWTPIHKPIRWLPH